MHFVICIFIALVCLVTAVFFTEVFPKWFKVVLTLIGSGTTGYAIAILIRKIAIISKAFTKPQLLPTFGICFVVVLILTIAFQSYLKKKKIA